MTSRCTVCIVAAFASALAASCTLDRAEPAQSQTASSAPVTPENCNERRARLFEQSRGVVREYDACAAAEDCVEMYPRICGEGSEGALAVGRSQAASASAAIEHSLGPSCSAFLAACAPRPPARAAGTSEASTVRCDAGRCVLERR